MRLLPSFLLVANTLGIACAGIGAEPVKAPVRDALTPLPAGRVTLGGGLGERIDLCIRQQISRQDVDSVVAPFRERKDKNEWRSEFWGKWATSAIGALRYAPNPDLQGTVDRAVTGLVSTQTPDGYIGAYPDGGHLQRWDIWGRKYTLLGLLAWHDLTGDPAALAAAKREADFILAEVGPGHASPFTNDMWNGMASSSVLEPMVLLYRRTGEARYLDFANYLVARWPAPDGPDLLRKSLEGVPVFKMFPGPKPVIKTYGDAGKSKAYEMMSCYEGLLELHRVTGTPAYREAVEKVFANIRDTEITLIGSGSDWERWSDGRSRQTGTWQKGMETCVTVTWMKLAAQLLRLTGDPRYADEIERATYNALLGAQGVDGTWWAHHSPLAGTKERAPEQCDMHQNCCVANGPRGLMLLPTLAVMATNDGLAVNFYGTSQASADLAGGGRVRLEQRSDYPAGDTVRIAVTPDAPRTFTLRLRIPEWSEQTSLAVNDQAVTQIVPGRYAQLTREWKAGDVVTLKLDLRPRVVAAPGHPEFVAVVRGPVVLARDRRLGGADVDAPVALASGFIELTPEPAAARPPHVGQVFRVAARGTESSSTPLLLCDFSSAGNTWSAASTYRVWMPVAKPSSN